jgi:hypothetical protein
MIWTTLAAAFASPKINIAMLDHPVAQIQVGRRASAASKRASSAGDTPRMRSTTWFAQVKYSDLRSADQFTGED